VKTEVCKIILKALNKNYFLSVLISEFGKAKIKAKISIVCEAF